MPRNEITHKLAFPSQEKLRSIGSYLSLVPSEEREKEENWYRYDIEFLRELLASDQEERLETVHNVDFH